MVVGCFVVAEAPQHPRLWHIPKNKQLLPCSTSAHGGLIEVVADTIQVITMGEGLVFGAWRLVHPTWQVVSHGTSSVHGNIADFLGKGGLEGVFREELTCEISYFVYGMQHEYTVTSRPNRLVKYYCTSASGSSCLQYSRTSRCTNSTRTFIFHTSSTKPHAALSTVPSDINLPSHVLLCKHESHFPSICVFFPPKILSFNFPIPGRRLSLPCFTPINLSASP